MLPNNITEQMVVSACLGDLLAEPPYDTDAMAEELIRVLDMMGFKVVRHNTIDDINSRFDIITKGIGRC